MAKLLREGGIRGQAYRQIIKELANTTKRTSHWLWMRRSDTIGVLGGTNHRTPTHQPASAVGFFCWMVDTPWVAKVHNWQCDPVVKPCSSHLQELHRKLEVVQTQVIITCQQILALDRAQKTGLTEEAENNKTSRTIEWAFQENWQHGC